MKSYQVTTIDVKGKTSTELFSSESEQDLLQLVKSRNLYLVDYQEAVSKTNLSSKLKMKSLVIFCRQLGTMISSGIPITQALDMLQNKADSPKAQRVFRAVYEEVQKGNSLSRSMSLQEGAFPNLLLQMIAAGELGGTLDNSLNRMSLHYEKEARLSNKIKSASIYPSVLAVVSVAVVLLLVMFVLPTITTMFDPKDMPWTTKIILGFSDFLISNWIVLLTLLVVSVFVFILMLNVKEVRIQIDKFKLYIPIVGKLNQTISSARCARALSSLYSSGIQTIPMLEITAKVLNNAYLEELFFLVITEVSKGELISRAISDTRVFDPMLSSMIYIGEESGSLGKILGSTADYFDDEADSAIQRLMALFEPVLLVTLGLVIGFIVVSIIQPIYTMYGSIGN